MNLVLYYTMHTCKGESPLVAKRLVYSLLTERGIMYSVCDMYAYIKQLVLCENGKENFICLEYKCSFIHYVVHFHLKPCQ